MGKNKKDENLFVAFAGSYLRFEEELGDANLFADWLFFRITVEFETEQGLRVGAVFRSAPLTDGDIARDMRERFGLRTPTARKVRRWRYVLAGKGIIAPLRTPRGHRLFVLDTNKFRAKPDPLPVWAVEIVNGALAKRPEGLSNIWHATDHERSGDLPPAVGGLTMSGQSNKRTKKKSELEIKGESKCVASAPQTPPSGNHSVLNALHRIAKAKGKRLSTERANIYIERLADLDSKKVVEAIDGMISNFAFFPQLSEIRDRVKREDEEGWM